MRITLEIKCPTCLSDSIKKNGIKVDGKQNYQCKDCKRQFIGDHALSYLGCNSGITRKILFTVGIEGNNCKIRHRIRRGFRRSCNFSKKIENHFKAFDLTFFYINNGFI
ncbi:IS1 family transposase [Acinetobacter haemolyticus]|uniref:IS1 family transposase n=1 Tax=Acinetobacter haemolyticus TaxID=29430 RepID=UPI00114E6283|nr:IS1 family transposase [Acinetobacter haemolyticus]QDJ91310.1 IS1 family transposase [Acinetobacter haemolyticus]